jgi:hypothetical protein
MQPQGTASERPPVPPGANDAELLQAIAAGSEPAFEELRGRYGRAVGSSLPEGRTFGSR